MNSGGVASIVAPAVGPFDHHTALDPCACVLLGSRQQFATPPLRPDLDLGRVLISSESLAWRAWAAIASALSRMPFETMRNPIQFKPQHGGRTAYGYPATVLADLCEAVLSARAGETLPSRFAELAKQCEVLVRGFAAISAERRPASRWNSCPGSLEYAPRPVGAAGGLPLLAAAHR